MSKVRFRAIPYLLAGCVALGGVSFQAVDVLARRSAAARASLAPLRRGIALPATIAWDLPPVSPCALVNVDEIESVIGPLKRKPHPGGSAIDGESCAYITSEPFVVTLGLISTAAFKAHEINQKSLYRTGATEFYTIKPNSFDFNLFARRGRHAIVVKVTASTQVMEDTRLRIAQALADRALSLLEPVL